jgi:hypothetical protein
VLTQDRKEELFANREKHESNYDFDAFDNETRYYFNHWTTFILKMTNIVFHCKKMI